MRWLQICAQRAPITEVDIDTRRRRSGVTCNTPWQWRLPHDANQLVLLLVGQSDPSRERLDRCERPDSMGLSASDVATTESVQYLRGFDRRGRSLARLASPEVLRWHARPNTGLEMQQDVPGMHRRRSPVDVLSE